MVEADPSEAERDPAILARWDDGSRAQLKYKAQTICFGGEGEPSVMGLLLASLAACDVEVVVNGDIAGAKGRGPGSRGRRVGNGRQPQGTQPSVCHL